jgi:nucleolar complex protein 3
MHKPERPKRQRVDDDLPSIDSHSDDGEPWDSGLDDLSNISDAEESSSSVAGPSGSQDEDEFSDSDAEMPYETAPRQRRNSWEPEENTGVSRLPIKLADGKIQKSKEKVIVAAASDSGSEEDEESEGEAMEPPSRRDDVATGARFGRPAVVDVIGKGTRKARIQAAREQIAGICQEIMADPENSVSELHFSATPKMN